MVSKEAQVAIDQLVANKIAKKKRQAQDNSVMAQAEAVFAERREGLEKGRRTPVPDKLSVKYDCADGVNGEWLRYLGADPEKIPEKVILFVHGGGFASGSALSRRALAGRIALKAKVDSFSIDYRQFPEYKFPAALDDCATAFLWLMKKGYAPENIVLFGESAGGNLALALPHYLKDHHFPLPGGVCSFSPVVEMLAPYDSHITRANRDAMIGDVFDDSEIPERLEKFRNGENAHLALSYFTKEDGASPYASPIRGDFTGYPRLMLQVGTEELLYDDAVETYKKATAAGVDVTLHEWEGMFHVFALFECPETDAVCQEIGQFIRNSSSQRS